ncbi:hypothetical protein, partial [Acetobacter syzygii]|uniref:hypothetical protein n=1 Tax=Acetobacter syzygii TaxID=146476 RepID=UPI0039ED9043
MIYNRTSSVGDFKRMAMLGQTVCLLGAFEHPIIPIFARLECYVDELGTHDSVPLFFTVDQRAIARV